MKPFPSFTRTEGAAFTLFTGACYALATYFHPSPWFALFGCVLVWVVGSLAQEYGEDY